MKILEKVEALMFCWGVPSGVATVAFASISNETIIGIEIHSKRKISNIWSFFLYIIWIWMIRSARTMIGNWLIVFLRGRVEGFFKQEGVGSTIQSNDIEHVSHLFLRNKR
ncbi:hypothetical protein Lal_00012595 [Lupinus albus]|nr:hypothetical protein Lal_00012595 [Lupinus albus]